MKLLALACVASLFTVTSAPAHHAFAAEFDIKRPIKLRGVVTKLAWINPHSWIYIEIGRAHV